LFFSRPQRRVRPDAWLAQAFLNDIVWRPAQAQRAKEFLVASASRTTNSRLDLGDSRTVRQFGRALGLALVAAVIGCGIYLVEKQAASPTSRFAENPLDVMVRCLGLAHFLVGWLFLFTSPRLRRPQALRRLLLWTLAGAAVCVLFACLGSVRNPILYLLFYGAFLFHEVRDEAVLYQHYEGTRSPQLLGFFSLAIGLLFVTLLSAGYALFLTCFPRGDRPAVGVWLVTAALAVACSWSLLRLLRLGRGELGRFLTEHRPLVVVYAVLFLILVLSGPLGSIGFIVLVHVASWLVFVWKRLQARQAATRNPWTWLRSTPTGFLVLHLGVALILLVLIAARVYAWGRVGFVSEILSGRNFCYWAIMHMSMSLWSSR